MLNSNTFSSNLYNRPVYETHQVVPVIVNESRLQRSNMPMQQIISNNQLQGQVNPISDSLTYSSHLRPVISPTGQQSGVYGQRQSYVPPGSNFDFI